MIAQKHVEDVGSEASALRRRLSDRFKYGNIGFCRKTKRSVGYTVDNVLRCGCCSFFVPSKRWRELRV